MQIGTTLPNYVCIEKVQIFEKQLKEGKLKPVWLFEGSAETGKSATVYHISNLILHDAAKKNGLRCDIIDQQVSARCYPNFTHLTPQENDTSIGIEQIRRLLENLALSPALPGARIVVIDSIDKVTFQGQNSLLKILEDLPPDTFFFLINHRSHRVLKTIQSRCQRLAFKCSEADIAAEGKDLIWHYTKGNVEGFERLSRADVLLQAEKIVHLLEQTLRGQTTNYPLKLFQNEATAGEAFARFWVWLIGHFVTHLHVPYPNLDTNTLNLYKKLSSLLIHGHWVERAHLMHHFYTLTEDAHLKIDDRIGAMLLILAGQSYEE